MSTRLPSAPELTRIVAANVLRQLRRTTGERRHELAGWAVTLAPDSRPALRLHLRSLIDLDDLGAAEALIARTLLQRPSDASLAALRGEILHRRGRCHEAVAELDLALHYRPAHRRTLELAGDIAAACGRPAAAAAFYDRVLARRRDAAWPLREKLVAALLATGRIDDAAVLIRRGPRGPVIAEARVLRAQGRLLDAAERLEAALDRWPARAEADRIHVELIDTLEAAGDVGRLRKRIGAVGPEHVAATTRAGRSLLGLGEFDEAARLVVSAARRGCRRRGPLHVLAVAAALGERPGLSRIALRRLGQARGGIDRPLMAECWRLGIWGRLLTAPARAGRVGGDHSPSVLAPLLNAAVARFDGVLADPEGRPDMDLREIERHRVMCEAALAA